MCAECSDHKQLLKYDPVKPQRVCDKCHEYFDGKVVRDEARKKGILEVREKERERERERGVISVLTSC